MKTFKLTLMYPHYDYHVVVAEDAEKAKILALAGAGRYRSIDGEYDDDIEITEEDV